MANGNILLSIISNDYQLTGNGRYYRSVEHDSLVIDVEKGLWFWNSKGLSGTVYTWLTKIKGLNHDQAKELLKQYSGFSDVFVHQINNSHEQVVYPKLVDVFYENSFYNSRDYWYSRGITDESIDRFKLGYYDGWYTIPFYQDGMFRNFQLRRDNPKKIRSYYKEVGPLLFNSDILKLVDTVYITEGPTDCIRLLQEGIPAVSHNSGAENWFPEWIRYFTYQKRIYVIYDNDHAGFTGAKKVCHNLGLYRTKMYTFKGFDNKYDIIDFFTDGHTREEFLELVAKNSKFAFEVT